MADSGDLAIAESAAAGAAKMIDGYLCEMRRQGRIHGALSVVVKDRQRSVRFQYRTPATP